MPRTTDKVRALQDIEDSTQVVAGCIAFSQSNTTKRNLWKNLETFVNIHSIVNSHRYLSRGNAGHHNSDILGDIIYHFSEDRFLVMFRLHRPAFWQLVSILEDAGGPGYWDGRETQQVAVVVDLLAPCMSKFDRLCEILIA